jgi:hypothetical protein
LDLIAEPDGDWRALREFLMPGDAVLFCNVLGQLEFLLTRTDAETRAYFQGLERALEGYEWASYHDRISGGLTPSGASKSDHALTNEELLTRFSPEENTGRGEKSAVETILADHSTGQLAPERARDYWIWELQPGRYHLIEGVK